MIIVVFLSVLLRESIPGVKWAMLVVTEERALSKLSNQ